MLFSSQLPNRPSRMCSGTHLMPRLSSTMRSRYSRRADVPGVLRVVDQRVAGAPTERIVVQILLRAEQQAPLAQDLDDRRVGILEELARDGRHGRQEIAVLADRVQHRQAVPLPELQVVLAVGRRDVHDAGAVLRRHELGGPHTADRRPRPADSRTGARNACRRARCRARCGRSVTFSSLNTAGDERLRQESASRCRASPRRTRRRDGRRAAGWPAASKGSSSRRENRCWLPPCTRNRT